MTTHQGLLRRTGAMFSAAFGRVLDELQANPVSLVVIGSATAISYESLYRVATGVGLPWWAAFLFPLTLDVAAYPGLVVALTAGYSLLARVFGSVVGLAALGGSIYGNLANHLAWAVIGSPSHSAIIFVSIVPPATVGTTLVLSLFRPQAVHEPVVVSTDVPETAEPVAPTAEPEPLPEPPEAVNEPAPSDIHEPTTAELMRQFVRDHLRQNGVFPSVAEVNNAFQGKSRNGHKAIERVRRENEKDTG